jgi:hypothetical protein
LTVSSAEVCSKSFHKSFRLFVLRLARSPSITVNNDELSNRHARQLLSVRWENRSGANALAALAIGGPAGAGKIGVDQASRSMLEKVAEQLPISPGYIPFPIGRPTSLQRLLKTLEQTARVFLASQQGEIGQPEARMCKPDILWFKQGTWFTFFEVIAPCEL